MIFLLYLNLINEMNEIVEKMIRQVTFKNLPIKSIPQMYLYVVICNKMTQKNPNKINGEFLFPMI